MRQIEGGATLVGSGAGCMGGLLEAVIPQRWHELGTDLAACDPEYSGSPHKAETHFRGHFTSGFYPSTDGNERLRVRQSGTKWVTLELKVCVIRLSKALAVVTSVRRVPSLQYATVASQSTAGISRFLTPDRQAGRGLFELVLFFDQKPLKG
jgi:hypothetical protein